MWWCDDIKLNMKLLRTFGPPLGLDPEIIRLPVGGGEKLLDLDIDESEDEKDEDLLSTGARCPRRDLIPEGAGLV
jgi:hypothetical protein